MERYHKETNHHLPASIDTKEAGRSFCMRKPWQSPKEKLGHRVVLVSYTQSYTSIVASIRLNFYVISVNHSRQTTCKYVQMPVGASFASALHPFSLFHPGNFRLQTHMGNISGAKISARFPYGRLPYTYTLTLVL